MMNTFADMQKGGKMISGGDLRKVFEYMNKYYSDYKGCWNCNHQLEPLQMCEWGKLRERVELICSGWERKKDG